MMTSIRKLWYLHPPMAALVLAWLSGCQDQTAATGTAHDIEKPDANTAASVLIDASAGGFGAAADDPKNKYSYFDLDAGQVVELSDEEAGASTAWDIAFKRSNFKLNGGVSGPGMVKGALADGQEDFYDSQGEAIASVFLNASADSELADFDAVSSTDALTFVSDRNVPAINGDGSDKGWWLYSGPPDHIISANQNSWWLVKSAAGDSYAKLRVTDIAQASRDISFELFIQGGADTAFSTTAVNWTAAIGAAGGSKCYVFDVMQEVDCTVAVNDWDIQVEVSADGRNWNIWTNGGVSGSGQGAAFGPVDSTGIDDYVSGTMNASGTDISRFYKTDSAGGVFVDNTWYAYDLQDNNKLWPNYRVYVIDTGTSQFKLQILSYYDTAGISGMLSVRYAAIDG